MKNSQQTSDLLATFDEAAERMISKSLDFQMNIQDFEDAINAYETDAQVFDAAIQVFESAAKDFRKATHDWGAASQSIKSSTQKFKSDAINFRKAIPIFRTKYKQLLIEPARSDIETSPRVNGQGHIESEYSFIDDEDQDEPATNGDQLNGAYSRMNIFLTDKIEKVSEKGTTSNSSSSVEQANHRKEENEDEQKSNETTPDTFESQTSSNDDPAQVQPSNKSKRRRPETKSKTVSEPKPKVRRRDTRASRKIVLAHLESPEVLEVDTEINTTKEKKVEKENATKAKENGTEKNRKEATKKSKKNDRKAMENDKKAKLTSKMPGPVENSKENDKKAKRTSKVPDPVEPVIQIVSTDDERVESTSSSTMNSSIQSIPKNTDREKHAKNKIYQKFCLFCDTESDQLVSHYVKQHAEHEVPISRPSPELATLLRSQEGSFKIGNDIIYGTCYFCDEAKNMTQSDWTEHYLSHTGESSFACGDYDAKSKRKNDKNNSGKLPEIFKMNSTDASLMGFICKDCNYLKIHLSAIEKHLKDEHGYESCEIRQHYEKVLLVPDLLPLQSAALTKYDFVAIATRFKCTICNKSSNDSKEFLAHFVKMHNGIKQYDCVCGKQVTAHDGQLDGKMITTHLSKHSTDLYQCMVCENVYQHRNDVRNHMKEEHPDDTIKYRHLCRSNGRYSFIAETIAREFKCKICHKSLAGTFAKIIDHFKEKHDSDEINGKMFVSKKVSYLDDRPTGIDTKYAGCISSHIQLEMSKE